MTTVPLTEATARQRLVKRSDMVACKVAFIDCKMPGSQDKENYSLIGAGVTQSADQVVNITEPHGLSMGVAAMPPGTVNNLHVHYTAEVFMIYKGEWTFRWGPDGKDGEIIGRAGDVVSIPTWIFRGFTNSGNEDGWIFTALGGDDTGGIIWHPSILETAGTYGLYLTNQNMLVDTATGAEKPRDEDLLRPIDRATVESFRSYTPEHMRKRVVTVADRQWSSRALLDSGLPGHASEMAPVLGYGMTEDRDPRDPHHQPAWPVRGIPTYRAWQHRGSVPDGGEAGADRLPGCLRCGGEQSGTGGDNPGPRRRTSSPFPANAWALHHRGGRQACGDRRHAAGRCPQARHLGARAGEAGRRSWVRHGP